MAARRGACLNSRGGDMSNLSSVRPRQLAGSMSSADGSPVVVKVGARDAISNLVRLLLTISQELEKRHSEAELLLRATRSVNAGATMPEMLDSVYEAFRQVIPYDRIGFALLEEENSLVRLIWVRSETRVERLKPGHAARLEDSSLDEILGTGRPRVLNDLKEYLLAHPGSDSTRRIVEDGMRSNLTCPLLAGGKPLGFLFFSSRKPDTYRDAHVNVYLQVAGLLGVVVEKTRLCEIASRERERAERWVPKALPIVDVDRSYWRSQNVADSFDLATVLFADLVDFTNWSSRMAPKEIACLLNEIFLEFDDLTDRFGVEKIKTSGDCYVAAAGIPLPRDDHAEAAAEMALAMLEAMPRFRTPDGTPVQLRVGIHSGPLVAGVIGRKKFTYDIWGSTVNVASRIETQGLPGQVNVSARTYGFLKQKYRLDARGRVELKGEGSVETYLLKARR